MPSQDAFAQAAQQRAKSVVQAGALPFSLGGDHSVTYSSIAGVTEVKGPLALLQFDAHSDTSKGLDVQHGTMFRRGSDNGMILADRSLQIGIRTAFIPDDAFNRLYAPEVVAMSADEVATTVKQKIGDTACYLHIRH